MPKRASVIFLTSSHLNRCCFGVEHISPLEQLLLSLVFPDLDTLLFPTPPELLGVQPGVLVLGLVAVLRSSRHPDSLSTIQVSFVTSSVNASRAVESL